MKPEEFKAAVQKGDIGPLYYIYGEEPFLAGKALDCLVEKSVDPAFRDFNLSVYYGNESKGEDIVATANTLPMFSEKRVVIVRRAGEISAAALEIMSGYVGNPSPSTIMVFIGEKIDQRKKFFTEFKRRGVMVECKKPYDNQLVAFVREEGLQRGKKIDPDACEMLVACAGTSLRELASQVEKAAAFAGTRERLTIADIKVIASQTRVDSIFELTNALGERHLPRALKALSTIISDGESPIMLIGAIARHFRQLWTIRQMLTKKLGQDEIARGAGISPYFLKGMLQQAKKFTEEEYFKVFESLHTADVAMKSGGGQPDMLIERVVFSVAGTRQ